MDFNDNYPNRDALENSKKLILLSGAGISTQEPSNIPLSKDISEKLVDLFLKIAFHDENTEKKYKAKIDLASLRIEIIFDILKNIFGEEILNCFSLINGQYPNKNHLYIAQLCLLRQIKNIFTLNFDELHEASFDYFYEYSSYKQRNRTISLKTNNDFREFIESSNNFNIFHLHGSFTNINEINVSILDIGLSLSKSKQDLIQNKLKNADIFCFGYSDHDPDIFPIIINSAQKIYWYIFNKDEIPNIVLDYQNKNPEKLKFIFRNEDENSADFEETFSDSLNNIFSRSKLKNRTIPRKIINEINQQDNHISIDERVDSYCKYIKKYIRENTNKPDSVAKFILGCIFRNQNHYDEALELFEHSKNRQVLDFFVYSEIANILEILERPEDSEKYWADCFKMCFKQKSCEKYKDYIRVRLYANNLKKWKRVGFKTKSSDLIINALCNLLEISKTNDENASSLISYTIADLLHHIIEYLPYISKINLSNRNNIVDILSNSKKDHQEGILKNNIDNLLDIAPEFYDTPDILRIIAAYYYIRVINEESRNFQYKQLSRLRLYEIYTALKEQGNGNHLSSSFLNEYCKNIDQSIEGIKNYYEWANIKEGVGNSYLTKGIIYFYQKNSIRAYKNFIEANKYYEKNSTGQIKCASYINRLNNL